MRYIKQLDSIRAIAVLLVIVTHWFPKDNFLYSVAKTFNGVDIFFTLSGFLITGILIKDRLGAEDVGAAKLGTFKNYFIRRALRIFPIYYLVLFILAVYNPSTDVIDFPYFASFTANFYFHDTQVWNILSHTWSLAVEEQFYLIWPWIILFLRYKYLPHAIVAFVFTGIIAQQMVAQNEFSWILTVTCLDTLAMGGLLAWFTTTKPHHSQKIYRLLSVLAAICLLLIGLKTVLHLPHLSGRTMTGVLTLWVITHILVNREKSAYAFSSVLNSKPLLFLGKMSYGIYLYHFILPYFLSAPYTWEYEHLNIATAIKDHPAFWLAQNFIILIAVSCASLRFIELPILNLKRHFKGYEKEQPELTAVPEMNIDKPLKTWG